MSLEKKFYNLNARLNNRLVYGLVVFLFLLPRVFNLGTDISNSDALRWHHRSENFLSAIGRLNFLETYQKYHPGVTLMWIGSATSFALRVAQDITHSENKTLENADFYPLIHGLAKLVLVIVLTVCFVVQLYLLNHLYGRKTAIIYGVLIATEPYFIGINRWFHLSSMEAFFATTSFLFVLSYLKNSKRNHLILSAVFSALGLLTKMTVLITVFFNILILGYRMIKKLDKPRTILLYFLVVIITFFILFPALWVDPSFVANKMYDALFNAVTTDVRGDLLSQSQKILYYPAILLFKMSPLVLIMTVASILFSVAKLFSKRKRMSIEEFLLLAYPLTLVFFLTVSDQKIDRYVIALFPPLMLLASLALSKVSMPILKVFLLLQLIHFAFSIFIYYPVLSAYISPVVTQSFVMKHGFYENSGEFYSQAALYLNTKGRNIYTYLPNNTDSFYPYYKGKKADSELNANYIVYGLDFDRKSFINFPNCTVERYFGNKSYKPVAVYKCVL